MDALQPGCSVVEYTEVDWTGELGIDLRRFWGGCNRELLDICSRWSSDSSIPTRAVHSSLEGVDRQLKSAKRSASRATDSLGQRDQHWLSMWPFDCRRKCLLSPLIWRFLSEFVALGYQSIEKKWGNRGSRCMLISARVRHVNAGNFRWFRDGTTRLPRDPWDHRTDQEQGWAHLADKLHVTIQYMFNDRVSDSMAKLVALA